MNPKLSPPPKKDEDRFDDWMIQLRKQAQIGYDSPLFETNATRTVADTDTYIICNRAGTITLTLPDPAVYIGRMFHIQTITNFTVVSATANVVPQLGTAAATAILAATSGKWADLVSYGTNWIIVRSN
jgi:hypothetical protein